MNVSTFHIPHKQLRPSAKHAADGDTTPSWDLYLDGTLVASEIVSSHEAQLELDLVAWYALFGEAPLTSDRDLSRMDGWRAAQGGHLQATQA